MKKIRDPKVLEKHISRLFCFSKNTSEIFGWTRNLSYENENCKKSQKNYSKYISESVSFENYIIRFLRFSKNFSVILGRARNPSYTNEKF